MPIFGDKRLMGGMVLICLLVADAVEEHQFRDIITGFHDIALLRRGRHADVRRATCPMLRKVSIPATSLSLSSKDPGFFNQKNAWWISVIVLLAGVVGNCDAIGGRIALIVGLTAQRTSGAF